MKRFVFLFICMLGLSAYAQDSKSMEPSQNEEVFVVVEVMPEFPGGQAALFQYLIQNVKYPVIAQENGIQGRVILQFIVNIDGSITNVEVVKSAGDASLDKEAVRVIKSMPKWKPGKQRGEPVRVKYTVPVNFRLEGSSKSSQSNQSASVKVHVGDTICATSYTTTKITGYCCDEIVIIEAPKTWVVNQKLYPDMNKWMRDQNIDPFKPVNTETPTVNYYILNDEHAQGIYNFTRYTNDVVTGRGRLQVSSTGNIQFMDTLYCYENGKLTEALLYTPEELGKTKTYATPINIPLKARIYDNQEQLLREYSLKPGVNVDPAVDWKGYIKSVNHKPIYGWTEFYKDGFYSVSIIDKDNTPNTIFYTPQGKKASVKQPKLKTPKKAIQQQLEECASDLHTITDIFIQAEVKFHVDENGKVLAARCGRSHGEFPSWYTPGRNLLERVEKAINNKLMDISLEFEPGTINKKPQRMMHTITFYLHNNPKLATTGQKLQDKPTLIPTEVHEGDTVWLRSLRSNIFIYKGDTIRYSPQYLIAGNWEPTHYAIIHEKENNIVEWHVYTTQHIKTAVLRHPNNKTTMQLTGAQDYYQDNQLRCSEYPHTTDNNVRVVWYSQQGEKEKAYLLTGDNIIRQSAIYKENGQPLRESYYYPDHKLAYSHEYDDQGEKHLIKPEKADIPWQQGDTVALQLLQPTYEAGKDSKNRYFMYFDEYKIENMQDDSEVYGVVEAVSNDTLWVAGYERSTGVKTCYLCYTSRGNGRFAYAGLQIYHDSKGLPMSGVTFERGIPVKSHWYKSDGSEYLNFDIKISGKNSALVSQMTWLSEQSLKVPEIKNVDALKKKLNNSLNLPSFKAYWGKVIALLIINSDGTTQILFTSANLDPKGENPTKQMAANELEDLVRTMLAKWTITPAKAGNENVSMPMVIIFDFHQNTGFTSAKSAHMNAKYDNSPQLNVEF